MNPEQSSFVYYAKSYLQNDPEDTSLTLQILSLLQLQKESKSKKGITSGVLLEAKRHLRSVSTMDTEWVVL